MASTIFLDIRFYPPVWVYPYMNVLPLELYSQVIETGLFFFFPFFLLFDSDTFCDEKNIKIYPSRVQVNNTLLTIVAMAYSAAAEFLLPESLTFPIITVSPKARMSLHSDSHHFTLLPSTYM